MPLHRIYHPTTVLTDPKERKALANAITSVYTRLPPFYVVVVFVALDPSQIYTGGEERTDFVRIVIEHLAVQLPSDINLFQPFMENYEAAIAPFIKDKGLDWELSWNSSPNEAWHINGVVPPPLGTSAFETWKSENRPSEYETATNTKSVAL